MNHPPTYVRRFSLHKVRENCHFLDYPPTPSSLRNIKMAPYVHLLETRDNKIGKKLAEDLLFEDVKDNLIVKNTYLRNFAFDKTN